MQKSASRSGQRSGSFRKSFAITTIYVTHDQEEALTLSDRIAVVDHGKLQQLGTPRDLYERPENPFVADFIGINNLIAGEVREIGSVGRSMKVETKAGPLLCFCYKQFKPGDRCLISVRPETATISHRAQPLRGGMGSAEM